MSSVSVDCHVVILLDLDTVAIILTPKSVYQAREKDILGLLPKVDSTIEVLSLDQNSQLYSIPWEKTLRNQGNTRLSIPYVYIYVSGTDSKPLYKIKVSSPNMTDTSYHTSIITAQYVATTVSYGVPQGSILGPSLFIIYVNDLLYTLQDYPAANIEMYADDTVLYTSDLCPENACRVNEEILNSLYNWCLKNKLTINFKKTNRPNQRTLAIQTRGESRQIAANRGKSRQIAANRGKSRQIAANRGKSRQIAANRGKFHSENNGDHFFSNRDGSHRRGLFRKQWQSLNLEVKFEPFLACTIFVVA